VIQPEHLGEGSGVEEEIEEEGVVVVEEEVVGVVEAVVELVTPKNGILAPSWGVL